METCDSHAIFSSSKHTQIQKLFFRWDPTLKVFLVDEGIQIQIKAGHHRLAIETPFKWFQTQNGVSLARNAVLVCDSQRIRTSVA